MVSRDVWHVDEGRRRWGLVLGVLVVVARVVRGRVVHARARRVLVHLHALEVVLVWIVNMVLTI